MRRGVCLAALLAATACSGGPATPPTPTPTPTPPPQPALVVSLELSPVATTSDPARPFLARWTIVLQETNGVPATLTFVNATVRDAASGAPARPSGNISLDRPGLMAAVGTNRVEAHGSLRIPESLQYGLPSGGRRATLTVAVQFGDDLGHVLTGTAQAVIQ